MTNRIKPLLMVLGMLLGAEASLRAAPKPFYSLVLNGDREETKGEPPLLCVYLNGNPIGVFTGSSSIAIQTNQFLKKGANEIRLTDTAKRQWSVQFAKTDGAKEPVLLLEKDADLQGKGEWSATVDLPEVDWSLPIFDKVITEADASGPGIPKFLESVFTALAAEDKTPAVSLVWKDGMSLWSRLAYGQGDEAETGGKQMMQQALQAMAKIEEAPSKEKMKIIRGRNTVLVYNGVTQDEVGATAYLGRWRGKDGTVSRIPPTVLYLTKAGWAIWQ